MADTISPRIRLDGEREFRAQIRAINTEFRNLRTEMKTTSAEFKGQENSEKALTRQKQLLTKAIASQEEKLGAAKDRLEKYNKAVEESGEETAQTRKKQAEYNRDIQSSQLELTKLKSKLGEVDTALQKQNSKWGQFQRSMTEASKKAEAYGQKMSSVGSAMTKGLTVPIAAMGAGAIRSSEEVEKGMANVIKATGATGQAAKSLEKAYKGAASNVSGSIEDIGSALGEVNTRFGFNGKAAKTATEEFMKFSKVTGTDAAESVRLVSRAMGDANMSSSQYKKMLDMLTVASQKTGISIDTLTGYVTQYGAPMRQLGFSTQQSIAMFAQWEKAGVTTEKAFSGMRIAISGWMKQGKNASDEFKKTVKGVQDGTISTAEAMEIFGKKGGPDMIDAIKQGRFNFEEFTKTLSNSNGALDTTYKNTLTSSDKLKIEMNKLKVSAADSGAKIMKSLVPALSRTMDAAAKLIEGFSKLPEPVQNFALGTAAVAAAMGPVLSGAGKITTGFGKVAKAFGEGGTAATFIEKHILKIGPAAASAGGQLATLGGEAAAAGGSAATAGSATAGLGTSLAALGPAGAIAGLAIAGVVIGLKTYHDHQEKVKKILGESVTKSNELASSTDRLTGKLKNVGTSYRENVASIQAHAQVAKNLNDRLQDLVKTQGHTASGQAQIKQIVDKLNETLPGLNLQYDASKNKLNLTNAAIEDNIRKMQEQAKQAAAMQVLENTYKAQYSAQLKLAEIDQRESENKKKLKAINAEINAEMAKGNGTYGAHSKKVDELKAARDRLQSSNNNLKNKEKSLQGAYDKSIIKARALELVESHKAKSMKDAYQMASAEIRKSSAGVGAKAGENMTIPEQKRKIAKSRAEAVARDTASALSGIVSRTKGIGSKAASNASPSKSDQANAKKKARKLGEFSYSGFKEGTNQNGWGYLGTRSGKSFLQALKEKLKIHSPSEATGELGNFSYLGFANQNKDSRWQNLGGGAAKAYLGGMQTTIEQTPVNAVSQAKVTVTPVAATSVKTATAAPEEVSKSKEEAKNAGQSVAQSTDTGLKSQLTLIKGTGANTGKAYAQNVQNTKPNATVAGQSVARAANAGALTLLPTMHNTGSQAGGRVVSGVRGQYSRARNSGSYLGQGINVGLKSQIPNVKSTAGVLVKDLKHTFEHGLGIHSPSTYGMWVGENTVKGVNIGINNERPKLSKLVRATVNDMKAGFKANKFSAEANVEYLDDATPKEVSWMRKNDKGSVVGGADGGKGGRFVSNMLRLVNDNRHGYSQANRWGPDYDCSSSIIASLRGAGFNTGAASTTHNMSAELTKHGWRRLPYRNPKKGDILLNDATHVEMSLGNGKNAGFHSSHGHPEPGDQAHEAYVGRDPGHWAAILRYKHGFGDSLADIIEEAYNFKKFGFGSLDAEGDDVAGASASGKLSDWVKAALKLTGQSTKLTAGLIRAAKAESGGNPRAVNNWDINAKLGHPSKGLMQTIDSTFNAYALKGHKNIWNPVDNMAAAIRYMIARYGSVENVLRPRAKRWYGYAVGSRYIPYDMPAMVHEGEMIIPKAENPYKNSGGTITGGLYNSESIVRAIRDLGASMTGTVNITINGAEGQNVERLAEEVVDQIFKVSSRKAAMISA